MNVLSLFAGIGGLDLGLERAGMTVVGQVEIDPYCLAVLEKHWPEVPRHDDVRTCVAWWLGKPRPPVDVVCGGFPCQPVSEAGRRRAQADERWLWPAAWAVIRDLRPRYAVLENVPGLLVRGMGDVLGDLAEGGYDAEWDCVPAAAVGAPHRRDRVFIVAHTAGSPGRVEQPWGTEPRRDGPARHMADADIVAGVERRPDHAPQGQGGRDADRGGISANVADAGRPGLERPRRLRHPRAFRGAVPADGGWWAVEPAVGRVAHGIPRRVDRLRALGNAVVPQVAEHIGRLVMSAARDD